MPPFTVLPGTPSDLDEMVTIWVQAMDADPFWKTWMGSMTESQIFEWTRENLRYRIVTGVELGVMQTWKVVDEESGKIAAWTGLSFPWPESLTDEERASLTSAWSPPEGGNWPIRNWYIENVGPMVKAAGYDQSKHFLRQGSMVLPSYQRRGLMTLLTQKCNSISDAHGAPTYVNARPGAAKMLYNLGFEVCSVRDAELGEFDEKLRGKGELENGETRFCAMRREVSARGERRVLK
ncbi:hypothetical protein ONS95_013516 [Cadophora gregata]|uniref:uncharacterized protein n=1 Tax=Cadophora gregata TaxID=51156 RepID=UPI0026DCAEC1|nr:uncharacterized protein ONS95_013516 [Cadophora gregata]KAK0099585.1 hypothetical protein ONS96_008087 [Cadophora gregata f. sp. sojae]KAK0116504.1 hypothetical protein ONS95_013516 [Cadophora gregata]